MYEFNSSKLNMELIVRPREVRLGATSLNGGIGFTCNALSALKLGQCSIKKRTSLSLNRKKTFEISSSVSPESILVGNIATSSEVYAVELRIRIFN